MSNIPPIPVFLGRAARTPGIALDANGRIDADLSCRACGYNLRGLLVNGRCPECAAAVGRSMLGDLLQYCDPHWVRKLSSGMNWIAAGIGLSLFIGIGGQVLMNLGSWRTTDGILTLRLVSTAVSFITLIGYWKLTEVEPMLADTLQPFGARRLTRLAQLSSFAIGFASSLMWTVDHNVLELLRLIGGIANVAGIFAVFTHCRQLAGRIPDAELAQQTGVDMWGLGISLGAGALLSGMGAFTIRSAIAPPASPGIAAMPNYLAFMLLGGGGCVFVLGVGIFGIRALILIGRYQTALRGAADRAANTWAA